MMDDPLSIALGALAVGGQFFNYLLHVNIKNAILESEKQILLRVDKDFVRKETCDVMHAMLQREIKDQK